MAEGHASEALRLKKPGKACGKWLSDDGAIAQRSGAVCVALIFVCLLSWGSTASGQPLAPPLSEAEKNLMIEAGRAIAQTQCSSCHTLNAEGLSPNPNAPPLRYVLSRRNGASLIGDFVDGLRVAHAPMPRFQFDPTGADSLMEYLDSIQQAPPNDENYPAR